MNTKSLLTTLAILGLSAPLALANQTLLPAGASWKYLDNGSNQGTAWAAAGFNDSAWAQGPGELG